MIYFLKWSKKVDYGSIIGRKIGRIIEAIPLTTSFKIKREYPKLKLLITRLLLVLEFYNVKPTYRKSWAGNLVMLSDLTLKDNEVSKT